MMDETGIDNEGNSLDYHKQRHTEYHQATIGLKIADMLGLEQNRNGKYYTARGIKTPLGLYLSIQQIIRED